MARGSSNIGVFNDLTVGSGNYVHSYSLWVGDTDNPGTPSVDTIAYQAGSIVVHNNILWLALRDNDNVEPTTTNNQDWEQISGTGGTGGGGIDLFTVNTSYAVNDIFFTTADSTLFPVEDSRNKIYRVVTAFTSGTTLTAGNIANLQLIGDGAGTGGNPVSAENNGTEIVADIRTLNFSSNITAVQNAEDNTQVDITVAEPIVTSGITLPITGTSPGDGFILTGPDGDNTPGYYYRNNTNTGWVKDDTNTILSTENDGTEIVSDTRTFNFGNNITAEVNSSNSNQIDISVPATGSGYPDTGGFAIDNLGEVTAPSGSSVSWPTGGSAVFGESDSFSYTPPTVGASTNTITVPDNVGGILTNNSGSDIELSRLRFDIDIQYDSSSSAATGLRVIMNTGGSLTQSNEFNLGARSLSGQGFNIISINDPNFNGTWSNGESIKIYIRDISAAASFSYTVLSLRVGFAHQGFNRIGSRLTDMGRSLPDNGVDLGDLFVLHDSDNTSQLQRSAPGVYFRDDNVWKRSGIDIWRRATAYDTGEIIHTTEDSSDFPVEASRNKIYRVSSDFISGTTLTQDDINDHLVLIGDGAGDTTFRGRWQQNTAYETGQVVFTDGTTSLFGEAVRNKIYRVENNFTSANLFDTANLAIIGERNTTYGIEAGVSTTANSADVRLVGSDITTDDVTITGGDNVTVTRNSDSQITIAADAGTDIPSGNTLPTTGTTAGDFFFLRTTSGTALPGLYERNPANDAWIPGNTDTNTTYAFTNGTGGAFTVQSTTAGLPNPPQSVTTGAADSDAPIRVWDNSTAYTTGDQVLFDQGGNVNSIYIAIQDSTGESPHDTTSTETEARSQTFWRLVRSGIVAVQTNGGTETGSGGITANTTLHINEGDGINIQRSGTTFTISAEEMAGGITAVTTLASAPADATVVQLTATDGTNVPGYYYRNSTSSAWIRSTTVTSTTVSDGVNTLTKYTDAEADARVQAGVEDWAETDNTARIPDDKMSLAALQRVQRVRLDGTTLRFYYGTDVSGNGDFTADVSDLANFPFFHYATITARNAATDHNGRSIFATVSNDTGDGSADPQGVFAAYVLTNPPAAGQPTVNGNWDRITSPDAIINEVCIQVYNEVTGMFETRSLGTTSAVEGLTENTANGLYLRQDGNLGDVDNIETARSNIGAAALTEVTTVEFPNSDDEIRLTNIEFNDAGDQLTFTNSNNATQSFTGGGQPNGGYPTVGGIALEQLGSVTHGATDGYSWPTGAAQVFGENADQITYTAGQGSGNQAVNGVLTNNTGSTIDLSSGVLDIDITITAITGTSLQAGFGLILPMGDATTPVVNAPFSIQLPITNTSNLPARLTVRVPIQGTANANWVDGGTIGLVVTELNQAERPFTYDVNAIRLSYTSHDFNKVGSAADIVFQETDGTITNLDSISVDNNNRLVFSSSTGSLIYAGSGGSGDVMSSDVITAWTSGTNYDEGRLVYTTTSNRYLPWRRNATAYSSDPATAETERTNSPDSTDGAALWDVLPPVINTTANSPIVVDRNGWNIGTVDHSLRRVSASGNRLDLAPTGITAGTYNNPHITIDQYGRAISANNGTALTDLPHSGFSYTRQDNLSDNLYTNRSQDVYNILGLFLAFNESATDVAEGTELYIFDNGLASTGTHVLTLRRNAEPETDIFEGHTFGWDVVFGFPWLEQFLGQPSPGSSTRDLDLTSTAATTAFNNLYIRDTVDRPAVLQRNSSGFVSWVEPDNIIDNSDPTNIATHGAINTAITTVNSRIDGLPTSPFDGFTINGTASLTTPIPRWTADDTLTWSAASTGGGGSTTFVGLTDTPNSYPTGSAGFAVRVNSDEDGVTFVEADDPGRRFNANERYEAGDLVTTPLATSPITYSVWVLRDGTLDGRTTAIPLANQPGGTGNNWFQLPTSIAEPLDPYIPVYFQLGTTGQAINPSLNPIATTTHYALIRSDSYGLGFDVFNDDGTLTSNAASNINTLESNDPPLITFLSRQSNSYFAPAIDTPEQMHDDLREWVSRDFEVQLNPHPDAGTITGHTFTLGGQTGTITNVSTDGRSFDISLTDEQRATATLAINPATDNHVDMVFTWVHNSVTHTWTNPIDLIEDLATTTTIGDFTVRRGTATGVTPGAVLHTMDAARLRLSGSTFGYFHTIASLTEGQDYVLVIDDVGSYSGGEISNGQQYRVTAPAINNFGGTFTDVRLITGGNVSDTQINWTFDDIFQSENVDVSIHALETAAAGLEILSGGNVIFRLEPNGNVQIAGTLTQNGT